MVVYYTQEDESQVMEYYTCSGGTTYDEGDHEDDLFSTTMRTMSPGTLPPSWSSSCWTISPGTLPPPEVGGGPPVHFHLGTSCNSSPLLSPGTLPPGDNIVQIANLAENPRLKNVLCTKRNYFSACSCTIISLPARAQDVVSVSPRLQFLSHYSGRGFPPTSTIPVLQTPERLRHPRGPGLLPP